jgi:hypothetical protein
MKFTKLFEKKSRNSRSNLNGVELVAVDIQGRYQIDNTQPVLKQPTSAAALYNFLQVTHCRQKDSITSMLNTFLTGI